MGANRARGQRAGLTRQAVLEAAVRLADREGLKALSMRRLGAELGVEAMTLYHHVPNKSALLDGMIEQVVAEAVPPEFGAATWREDLRTYAHALVAALGTHPHAVPLLLSRPAMTPRNLRTMEAVVGMLYEAGFPLPRTLDVLYSLTSFVVGHAAAQAGSVDGAGDMASLDPDAYPLLVSAAREAGGDAAVARFDFALEALLSGFERELALART
ncbi:TetR/AcrR family transcriptional regulator C-terminal domain-containing protein [Streptomyces sp. NBC_01408]|uniref:TetR/AcrR family transcriptional regulator C-terminal domain-containing protein n=1 Tax=Streptomyces sp. NBC_01408 TaxID=2903855 RepID=UPI002253C401|nr:TetR/AcrR family transcriptional regulator C-terminal domain-containing protein [Streptomyces sp. NBC_01408]MCX4695834.1 TetR/AcrR family transcriptional regulator C-terminal domain-containing protein [Streptomyces sp. NBC_01408]